MTFMEEPEVSNMTVGIVALAHPQSYPAAPFPAWLPAVSVAISMLIFLAGSFYLRHRKVMKKRQILMDYFYIIFQYGGTRRKRMVTALCNTNAITLRELGRSFMISCDSMTANDTESSCPFYLDDSACSRPQLRRPLTKKYSLLKRGFTITRRNRGPFLRFKTESEDNTRHYPHSFQDIVMKLGGRRQPEETRRCRSPNRQTLVTPQFEGCSMSTIHGDEMEYERPKVDREKAEYCNKRRRNAHILQYDENIPRFADVAAEVARRSLTQAVPNQIREQQSPYKGKRKSEPWRQLYDQDSQTQGLQPDVFHTQRGLLSPSSVRGSHGYISSTDKENNTYPSYRNSEPTILVHSPSLDADGSQGWNDMRSKYTNGVVFLKRVSKEDGSPGEYYYEESRTTPVDRPVRTSLSKVSYVASGNMNQYQNCILTPNIDKAKEEEAVSKKSKGESVPQGVSKSKRGRLNLGRMGVGNFSRRIDLASDSLQDYEPEHSPENKSPSDAENPQLTSGRTKWTRFKSVFSGSREVANVSGQVKIATSLSVTEQQKTKPRRERTNWQKFISVFTPFRSFPEDKKEEDEPVNVPKSSNSVPLGLNLIGNNSEANFIDIEAPPTNAPLDVSKHSSPESCKHVSLSSASSFSDSGRDSCVEISSTVFQTDFQRPKSLNISSRTQSFPEETTNPRHYFQRFQKVFEPSGLITNKPFLYRQTNKRYGKLNSCIIPHAAPLTKSKRDFKSYSFEAGYISPGGEYRFKRCPTFIDSPHAATPDRLEGNSIGSEISLCPRRFRSLSPLLEINCTESNTSSGTKLRTNLDSVPCCSVYMTPVDTDNCEHISEYELKSREEILHPDVVELERDALEDTGTNIERQTFLYMNSNASSNIYSNDHSVKIDQIKCPDSQRTEPRLIQLGSSDARLQLNTIFGSNDKLPHSYFLKPDHKVVSCSTDSVYYDTVSAIGTPSSCEPKWEDFAQISHTEHTWRNTESKHINLIDNDLHHRVLPSSFDAILSPDLSDTQTLSSTEPPIVSMSNVPCTQQSSSLSSDSQALLDYQCNKLSNVLFPENHTAQGTNSTIESTEDNLQKTPQQYIECNSVQSSQRSTNEKRNKSPNLASYFNTMQTGSLPVPVRASYGSEHHSTSTDSSPKSSRSPTPTRRHSTPSPSPERRSGCYTPDQMYMANVTRLPRLSQRLQHSGTMPSLCHVKYIHE